MDEPGLIKVSPRHSVRLAQEYAHLIGRAPQRDFVVRTLARREASGLPLMTAELVIGSRETRERFPLAAAGLWRMAQEAFAQLQKLHDGGLAHGDLELHNLIVCPAPLEPVLIDFGNAVERGGDDASWRMRCDGDFTQLLREAVFLQCALGRQPGPLADLAWQRMGQFFKAPDRFRREMDQLAEVKAGEES